MNEYFQIIIINTFVVLSIVSYGTYRCKTSSFRDPLTMSFVSEPWNKYLDGWGILHYSLFALLGYFFPSKLIFLWCLGFIWELIEFSLKDKPFYISKCNYTIDTDDGQGWWYGRWQDIVMNSLGLLTGYLIANYDKITFKKSSKINYLKNPLL